MGGGFHHFGYRLVHDEAASDSTTNAWSLCFYSEGAKGKHLSTVKLPSLKKLSAHELLEKVTAGYDEQLVRKPRDIDAYKGKVELLLGFGKVSEAREACREWMERMPNYWLPKLTYAHVLSRLGESDAAAEELAGWVSKHKNFAHYIYLFLFSMREGRKERAIDAIRKALDQPFIEPRGSQGNKFYLGHNGAVFAFMQGEYRLCLAMCEKMLSDERREDYWRGAILKLKSAAHLMLGSQQAALQALDDVPTTEGATWGVTDKDRQANETFVSAIRDNRGEYIRDYRNWKDEFRDWFCPYNVRGACLLYSEEWNKSK
jgi:tetratricopeptide (TPR) repeat protein